MSKFGLSIRVYHEDVDTMSVVYYANYLKFYERARTEHLRVMGFDQDALMTEHEIMFVVRKAEIDYLKPARYNDLLWVTADVSSLKKTSFQFDQKVTLNDQNGALINSAKVGVVCVSSKTVRPCAIPAVIIDKLKETS